MSTEFPHPPEFGPDIPAGDVQASFSELSELRDNELIDASGNIGPWGLLWGSLGVVCSLLLEAALQSFRVSQ